MARGGGVVESVNIFLCHLVWSPCKSRLLYVLPCGHMRRSRKIWGRWGSALFAWSVAYPLKTPLCQTSVRKSLALKNIGQCGRLSQLSWLLGALWYSYLLTYLPFLHVIQCRMWTRIPRSSHGPTAHLLSFLCGDEIPVVVYLLPVTPV